MLNETRSIGDRIRSLVCTIPPGLVATYGDVSTAIYRNPARGRAVGSALRIDGDHFPWWRVILKDGWIPDVAGGFYQVQIQRLTKEGVKVVGGRVDLATYRHVLAR